MKQMIFLGAKPSYFRADDGTVYDNTKVYLAAPLAGDTEVLGYTGIELKYGTSADFNRLRDLKPMHPVLVDIDIETTGRKVVQVLRDIKPAPVAKV